jgi:hypothetical protein
MPNVSYFWRSDLPKRREFTYCAVSGRDAHRLVRMVLCDETYQRDRPLTNKRKSEMNGVICLNQSQRIELSPHPAISRLRDGTHCLSTY